MEKKEQKKSIAVNTLPEADLDFDQLMEVKGGIHGRMEKAKAEIKAKEADKVPKNKSKDLATAL